ncbi:maternal effect embryo arrest 18, partial [Striga asiatica]
GFQHCLFYRSPLERKQSIRVNMADTCLGTPLFEPFSDAHSLINAQRQTHFRIQFSFSLYRQQFFPVTRNLSLMAPARKNTHHYHSATTSCTSNQPSLLVFSGGTAFNGVVEEIKKLTTRVAHVLPVSDDGGSTAEIVRVLGGPAVGDIRSRCLRLSDQSSGEALAVRTLLGHRLPLEPHKAKLEWYLAKINNSNRYDIVEGSHSLWTGVSKPYRETIRAFLAYFQNQILRRSDESFCFSNGSIGNFFFAGARIFFQSLDAAIFLFSRVSAIPTESLVLPVISTNDRLTLGCELWNVLCRTLLLLMEANFSLNSCCFSSFMQIADQLEKDGTIMRGQNEISHPTNGSMEPINKNNSLIPCLPSRIKRVFYMSSEGSNLLHEVFPSANPTVLEQLKSVDCIIFAMGSLFTSICPSLGAVLIDFQVLHGIGEIISSRACSKVLLLNGTHDRETCDFTASCFVTAITDALNRKYGGPHNCLVNSPSQYINTVFAPKEGHIPIDIDSLAAQGIFHVVIVDSVRESSGGILYDPKSLTQTLSNLLSGHPE